MSATLTLNKAAGEDRDIQLFGCKDSSWSELIVNWNIKPSIGSEIVSQQTVNSENSFDVTAYVVKEIYTNGVNPLKYEPGS